MNPVRIVICDDHQMVRTAFRVVLSREPDFQVVGEANNGQEALDICHELRPDVVLMDLNMPVVDGLEATHLLKNEFPATGVLILTADENPEYLLEAIDAGAAGYVLKNAPIARVIDAIRRVVEGESPLDEELATKLIQSFSARSRERRETEPERHSRPLAAPLTERELEVLRLLVHGLNNPEIAQTLTVSRATIKTHVSNILRKLQVSDRTQAVVYAIDSGLVIPESG